MRHSSPEAPYCHIGLILSEVNLRQIANSHFQRGAKFWKGTLREVVQLAVGVSDNGAEEILVRLVGGPLAVQNYMHLLGINAIQVRYSERDLDRDENLQYQDWIESTAAVELLERLAKNSPVSPAMNAFLLKTMADSQMWIDCTLQLRSDRIFGDGFRTGRVVISHGDGLDRLR